MPDRAYFNKRRQDRREKFRALLGGKCERCGSTKNLQFDHKNPKKKEFRIADRLDANEKVLEKEVKKCRLLCEPCHRQKTLDKWEVGQPKPRHGSPHYYKKYKCRCKKCKEAMSKYYKERKRKLQELAKS